jgi:hypothetical protein
LVLTTNEDGLKKPFQCFLVISEFLELTWKTTVVTVADESQFALHSLKGRQTIKQDREMGSA